VWPASQPTHLGTKKSFPPQLILVVIWFLREMCNLTEFSVFENRSDDTPSSHYKTPCCLNYLSYSENLILKGASPQMQQSHELRNREKWRKLPAVRGARSVIFYLVMWKFRTNRTRYFITLLKNPLVEMVLSRDEKMLLSSCLIGPYVD
jgi:hypothetical protein